MTEAQWLAGTNPEKMLAFVLAEEPLWPLRLLRLFGRRRSAPSERKVRLFMCACAHKVSHSIGRQDFERTIQIVERIADGELTTKDLTRDYFESAAFSDSPLTPPSYERIPARLRTTAMSLLPTFYSVRDFVRFGTQDFWETVPPGVQSTLIRHIFGNPFRPYPPPDYWPATVLELANAVYAGQNCAPMLADALEEAGHAELGEHMRSESVHPKGCWVLDLILGKS